MLKNLLNVKIRRNKKEKGQSLVEYGLILALVSVVAIVILQALGGEIQETMNNVGTALETANDTTTTGTATFGN